MGILTNRLPYIERLTGYGEEFPPVFNTPYGTMRHSETMTAVAIQQFVEPVKTILEFDEQESASNFPGHGVYYVAVLADGTVHLMVTNALMPLHYWSRTGRVSLVPASARRVYNPTLYRDWVVNEGLSRDWEEESLMARSLEKKLTLWQQFKNLFKR